jgi:hypothetical protein
MEATFPVTESIRRIVSNFGNALRRAQRSIRSHETLIVDCAGHTESKATIFNNANMTINSDPFVQHRLRPIVETVVEDHDAMEPNAEKTVAVDPVSMFETVADKRQTCTPYLVLVPVYR